MRATSASTPFELPRRLDGHIPSRFAAAVLGAALALTTGCAAPAPSGAAPSVTSSLMAASPSISPPSASPAASASVGGALVGEWARIQTCDDQLQAFEAAGLADTHREWLTGNWFGNGESPGPAGLCAGARAPEQHSHFFTESGRFGSRDAGGNEVDDGDYLLVDPDTVAFPSHAREFRYSGEVVVDYAVNGNTATFRVKLPTPCDAACRDAYAWALSAFFGPVPWTRT